MKKKMKKGLALLFGVTLLFGAVNTTAYADEAEPCDVHTYSYDCDTTCNICGHERSASHAYNQYGQNYYYHWLKCECGAKLDILAHEFDSDADLTCNECGYERHLEHDYSIFGADSTYHWDECSCGEKINKEEHLLVSRSDGTWHWNECAECGTKVNIGAHVWGAGVADGDVTTYTCTICAEERTVNTGEGQGGTNTGDITPGGNTPEATPGVTPGTTSGTTPEATPGTTPGTTPGGEGQGGQTGESSGDNTGDTSDDGSGDDDDAKDTKGGNFGKWLFGGITAAVVLWGGAIAGLIIYRKKKEDKDSVKESKESV